MPFMPSILTVRFRLTAKLLFHLTEAAMLFTVRKTWLGMPTATDEPSVPTQILAVDCSRDEARNLAEAVTSIYRSSSYDRVLDCWVVEDADTSIMTITVEGQELAAA